MATVQASWSKDSKGSQILMPGAGGLLPQGLRDRLPGEAAAQARTVRALLDTIEQRGYDRVSPPLAELVAQPV